MCYVNWIETSRRSVWILLALVACRSAAPSPPAPEALGDLVRRHYDQVCRVDVGSSRVVTVSEVFDTVGLEAALGDLGARPLAADPRSEEAGWGGIDFVIRYGSDGKPQAMGRWEASLDSATTFDVEAILSGRVRPLPGLLAPEGFRAVVELSARPTVRMEPAVVCLPHIRHGDGERPEGLPEGVVATRVRTGYRPRRSGAQDPHVAVVRVHLDRSGAVTTVEGLSGAALRIEGARDVVSRLSFDPGLRNGEGIPSEIVLRFRFAN